MNKNRTQFAILGMLMLEPMSGYDFRKAAGQCLGFFWQESYGQIYPTLKKMYEKGYLSRSCEKTDGKPDRYVYSITQKGEEAFHNWLDQKTRIEPKRNELLLKLFFGGKPDRDEQIQELESIKETNEKLLAELKNIEDWHLKNYDHHALTPYWLVTIRFGIHRVSAMISWCTESIETLREAQKETFSSVPDPISFYFKSRKT
jgi:DNA-binding PadR family transcriptional regulator